MGEDDVPLEGVYQRLAEELLAGFRAEGNVLVTGKDRIEFRPSQLGYEILLGPLRLGETPDNYFLVYLTQLFEGKDDASLQEMRRFSEDKRLVQATELQGTIGFDGREYDVGKRKVGYSRRYFDCSCPDWKYRRKLGGCKHIAALRLLDV